MVDGTRRPDGRGTRRGSEGRAARGREERHPRPRPAPPVPHDVRGRFRGAALASREAGRAGDPRKAYQVARLSSNTIADDEPGTLADAHSQAMTMIEAVNDALDIMLERDPDVVLLGEDIGYFGGVFRCTAGL